MLVRFGACAARRRIASRWQLSQQSYHIDYVRSVRSTHTSASEPPPPPASQTVDPSDVSRSVWRQLDDDSVIANDDSTARDHLANERTFLAWLRTSLACIALSVPLHELLRFSATPLLHFAGAGSLLLSTGLLVFSARRYYTNAQLLRVGLFRYNRRGVGTLTAVAVLLSGSLFVLLASAGRDSLLASGEWERLVRRATIQPVATDTESKNGSK
eukprot:TRINITY_DN452_c0_g1_i1.p1 TRINITY_DN452_c0_g1~~TRINITY_DN452_c0_g1_i1.p1  ORF type:complete len:214 (+),score=23.52 TRINITY_DN452_c0_g1_i1:400-1041(+)